MPSFRRSLIGLLLGLWAGAGARAQASDTPDALLIGAWRHTTLVRVVDGETLVPQQFDGSSILEFMPTHTWVLTSPQNRAAGTYRWLESGELETTTLESGLAIQVGTVSRKQVRVDAQRLNLITIQTAAEMAKFLPPPKPGVRRPSDVTITSVFSRVPGAR